MRRALILLVLLLVQGAMAQAAQRALLVGVSELASQPTSLWLSAPRNDVILMRQVLQQHGFASDEITVLADGVSGAALPDSRQIRDALQRLLARSQSGDFVLLYFSGHGTRVRDATKRYAEPDGLAENFLARDARLAPGNAMPLAGGLRDVDFDGWIRAFMARGVFVWSVFDTCSAASMTRGVPRSTAAEPADDEVRFRGIQADELARGGADAAPAVEIAPPPEPPVPRARYVAFFASESHQVTPELRLPRNDRAAKPQGLLTWAVAESLGRRPASFRDLFNQVVSLYAPVISELESRFPQRELPSPVAEGNLDLPLFAGNGAPQTTRPAWPARRAGSQLTLSVGQLDGLEPQQEVRVVATLADGTQRAGTTRLEQVELASARTAVPAALAEQDSATLWTVTPVDDPPSVVLRVQPAPGASVPAGLSLAYPAAIRVLRGGDADVRVQQRGGGAAVEILSPELAAWVNDGSKPYLAPDAQAYRQQLTSLAQLKWLARLNQLAQGGRLDGFEATLETWQGEQMLRSAPAATPPPGPMAPGERQVLVVRNASGQSLDLVVVGVEAGGAIRQVYPQALSETNRFERGTREQPAQQRFELPWLDAQRGGRLLVLAAPAAPFSAPRLFGAAPPEASVAELRVRGALQPERQRQVFSALLAWPAATR
ncbi:caspase family protein [Variovorax sp. OV329]|uniref:caspase family protein n=1 Tax=Variovorax sp. OV329 TaxID=1882825 RepID=UPI0008E371D9|nr:caspase family protein [Variovorax sp. OV329]SFM81365.1 Caspase domain-containing protein [Variovorax sp. OV329]